MTPTDQTESFDDYACPLCAERALALVLHDAGRRFARCACCDLISVHPADRPTPDAEAQRYLAHRNDAADDGYVRFLRRLADPLCAMVPAGSRGLDVGCGPAPVLAALLTESGRPTAHYDPLFFPRRELLDDTYDFVSCTEVAEHAHDPAALFHQLIGLLRPGGTLGVMTSLHGEDTRFNTWWYRRDITHVCFYSERTMQWIGKRWSLDVEFAERGVILFTRSML